MADIKQIQFKRSSVIGKRPTAAQIAEGELAINLRDRTLFTKDDQGLIVDLGFAKGGEVTGNINQTGNFTTTGSINAGGTLDAKTATFDYTVRLQRTTGSSYPNKPLAIQSDGTSTNDLLIQHWGNRASGGTRESILEFKFGTSASHSATKFGMLLQRATDNTITFEVNGRIQSADYILSENFIRAGGSNGLQIASFTGNATPIRSFQFGNFTSSTYENAVQFTDNGAWLGEIGTRKVARPGSQTKTEFKINGCITSLGNADSYRINYGEYGTFWRNDGGSLYLMQTAKGDVDGSYNAYRPFRLNLADGDVTINNNYFYNAKTWLGVGTAVTTNTDSLGVAGLTAFIAIGDSDSGVGLRGDGVLNLMANNVNVVRVTSNEITTHRRITNNILDASGRVVMPGVNSAIVTIGTSGDGNNSGGNGLTLLGYNSGDKYSHYFRGNGNFVVNMPYASFDKDVYLGGFINAAYIHSRGSINTTTVPQGTYKWDDLNNGANNGAKSYLRRWRSQGNAIIWHETCTGSTMVISTGSTDSDAIWGYNTNELWHRGQIRTLNYTLGTNNMLQLNTSATVSGEANGLLRGRVQGGAWVDWRARSAGLLVDMVAADNAHSIWKSTLWGTAHVAAQQILVNSNATQANCRLQVLGNNYDFTHAGLSTAGTGYFTGDLATGANLRGNNVYASNGLYWGPNGAWAASDGNIWGTQWGEGGTAAWMGGNVVKTWGTQTMRGVLNVNGGSIYVGNDATSNKHVWFNFNGVAKGLIYGQSTGDVRIQTRGTSGNKEWVFAQNGNMTAPGAVTAAGWMYATEFYLNSDRRLKTNIVELESVSDKLHKVNIKRYSMKDGSNDDAIGVIAQEVQDVFPELVSEQENGMLTVNYRGLATVLWKITQEQDIKLQSIEERLNKLGV